MFRIETASSQPHDLPAAMAITTRINPTPVRSCCPRIAFDRTASWAMPMPAESPAPFT